jgi:hypothetical protein
MEIINFLIKLFVKFWIFCFIIGFLSTYFIIEIWPKISEYLLIKLVKFLMDIFNIVQKLLLSYKKWWNIIIERIKYQRLIKWAKNIKIKLRK